MRALHSKSLIRVVWKRSSGASPPNNRPSSRPMVKVSSRPSPVNSVFNFFSNLGTPAGTVAWRVQPPLLGHSHLAEKTLVQRIWRPARDWWQSSPTRQHIIVRHQISFEVITRAPWTKRRWNRRPNRWMHVTGTKQSNSSIRCQALHLE